MKHICNSCMSNLMTHFFNSSANLRVLLEVQCKGDSGSPRVVGSIRFSRSDRSAGSLSILFLRPPPEARMLPLGTDVSIPSIVPLSSSLQPFEIVSRLTPVARETMLIPPAPRLIASAATNKRLFCSSRKGFINSYFSEIICSSRLFMYVNNNNLYKKLSILFCYCYLVCFYQLILPYSTCPSV